MTLCTCVSTCLTDVSISNVCTGFPCCGPAILLADDCSPRKQFRSVVSDHSNTGTFHLTTTVPEVTSTTVFLMQTDANIVRIVRKQLTVQNLILNQSSSLQCFNTAERMTVKNLLQPNALEKMTQLQER